jgi:hypothetical protein
MVARSEFSCELPEGAHVAGVSTGVSTAIDPDPIPVGTRVEVRSLFIGTWSRGFEIADHRGGKYRIKRLSDGSVLPDDFDPVDVRPERRKRDFWWY